VRRTGHGVVVAELLMLLVCDVLGVTAVTMTTVVKATRRRVDRVQSIRGRRRRVIPVIRRHVRRLDMVWCDKCCMLLLLQLMLRRRRTAGCEWSHGTLVIGCRRVQLHATQTETI